MKNEMLAEPEKQTGKYKHTELGLIPEDWECLILKHIATLYNGRAYKQDELLLSGKYEVLRVGNFFTNNSWYFSDLELPTNQYVERGDLMYAWSASFGPKFWYGKKCIYHYHIWKVVPKNVAYKDYLFHLFEFDKTNLLRQVQGGTMSHLTKGGMENRYFILPPLPEQTAIATALSDADALIAGLEKLIEKKKKIKQGAMQELLSPVDKQGKLKEGWVKRKLGEIGYTYGGLSGKSKADFSDGNSSYIQFMNIMSNAVIELSELPRVYIRKGEKQNTANKDDMFFNGSSETPEEVGMCSVLLHDVRNLYLNSFCFGFRPFEANMVDGLFLANYFRSPFGRKLFFSSAQGATRYNLSKSNFLKLEILLPDYKTQCEIASVIQDLDSEILNISRKLRKTQLLKQGMMQNLLTGKIRLIQNK